MTPSSVVSCVGLASRVLLGATMLVFACGGSTTPGAADADAGDEGTDSGSGADADGSFAQDTPSALSLGAAHGCVAHASGGVSCWGRNDLGQLGLGFTSAAVVAPALAAGFSGSGRVSAGAAGTTCAIVKQSVMCAGSQHFGALGNGVDGPPPSPLAQPTAVLGLAGTPSAVSLGVLFGCALSGSAVYCWGNGYHGQMGDGNFGGGNDKTTAVAVDPGAGFQVQEIATGASHACVRDAAGRVICWGFDWYGQIGDGMTGPSRVVKPTPVSAMPAAASQLALGDNTSYALLADGTVASWGANDHSQMGIDSAGAPVTTPNLVPGVQGVKQIAAGGDSACACTAAGEIVCWGANDSGQTGTPPGADVMTPTAVKQLPQATFVAVGDKYACAISVLHEVWCWGNNSAGQLGNGNAGGNVSVPARVQR